MHSSTAAAMTVHIAACHFFNNGEKFFYFEVRLLMTRVVIYHSLISMLILILHAVTCIYSQYVKIRFAVNALVASLT